MALTFGRAREVLARYAGRGGLCPDSPQVASFVITVLESLLHKGPIKSLRSWTFQAQQGCITLPYELETPVEVKINDQVGTVWSTWFKYYEQGFLGDGCVPAANALQELPNYYPTVYDLPPGGGHVGVLGHADEKNATIIIKGKDLTNREIFSEFRGEQISGSVLEIVRGQIRYTKERFGKIESVVKTTTKGYATLFSVDPHTEEKKFLADYSPLEEIPQYRRFKLTVRCADCAEVNVLGRIRLKERYHDSDVIPISNLYALQVAAQGINLNENNDVQGAITKDSFAEKLLTQENQYKKAGASSPVKIFRPTSGGAIMNVVSRRLGRFWGRGRF